MNLHENMISKVIVVWITLLLSSCFLNKEVSNKSLMCSTAFYVKWQKDVTGCMGLRAELVNNCLLGETGRDNYAMNGLSKRFLIKHLGLPNKTVNNEKVFIYHILVFSFILPSLI